jgi:hypothetical protein
MNGRLSRRSRPGTFRGWCGACARTARCARDRPPEDEPVPITAVEFRGLPVQLRC